MDVKRSEKTARSGITRERRTVRYLDKGKLDAIPHLVNRDCSLVHPFFQDQKNLAPTSPPAVKGPFWNRTGYMPPTSHGFAFPDSDEFFNASSRNRDTD
jgi:hypothetical protein